LHELFSNSPAINRDREEFRTCDASAHPYATKWGILAYWVVHRISIFQEGQSTNREMIGYNPGYMSIAILYQFYAVSL
jgi:hypothetical protein